MSANSSNLSSPKYGYDFVVATTQASINATVKSFLSALSEPVTTVCYVADAKGNPTAIDYAELKKLANDADPFAIPPTADPATDPDLQNLIHARFMMGFRAQLGLPPGLPPAQIPDIVTLGGDTSAVIYNLLCSQFTVVELNPGGGYSPPTWFSESQQPGKPWVFTSKVDLRLTTADESEFGKLPQAVQAQIKNLGPGAFSVQQLLFDLDNAALENVPTISGVVPGTTLYQILQQAFLGAYFTQLQSQGQPLLGCTIKQTGAPTSTLTLSDLNLEVNPFVDATGATVVNPTKDQLDLATLNYLCAADGDALPVASRFNWNWIDPAEEADYDGVVAINRHTFANYFHSQLIGRVSANCYRPSVTVTYDVGKAQTNYAWSLTRGQQPTVTMPPSGPTVLTYHYDAAASDQAGLNGDLGRMELHPSYDCTVTFSGTTIQIVQHLVVYLYARSLATSADGNVVDLTVTDTYTLAVGQDGRLAVTLTTARRDDSKNPSTDPFLNFFTQLNSLISSVSTWLRGVTSTSLTDIPVSVAQNFVFPGGRTFAFKSVAFAGSSDLVSHITYTDPS
ncbi:hypothetical protein BIV57_07735 [Mangrovactinospora gilvigrisea]|uniref:Uncharacterized protein n=1 Tax=Mangrovactinospora gilvigrisea TaxID=1428644 RepID=A0A1J7BX44_9ACTN|nr:hypothetical protein [Mangrovactinospora gilvigrisea]OIV38049.1 hypothetical protein BIV57_07735 [Mangrovactinospora gilvigrisea]